MQISTDLNDPGNPQNQAVSQVQFESCSFPTGRTPLLDLDEVYSPVASRKTWASRIVNPALN